MKIDEQEQGLALQWLIGAGLFSVLLSGFLVWADGYLSGPSGYAKQVEAHDAALKHLRTSQFLTGRGSVDERMDRGIERPIRPKEGEAAETALEINHPTGESAPADGEG